MVVDAPDTVMVDVGYIVVVEVPCAVTPVVVEVVAVDGVILVVDCEGVETSEKKCSISMIFVPQIILLTQYTDIT